MSETHTFDLVLRGGRILDPANGLDLIGDLAVAKGRIAAVAERLPDDAADTILDVTGKIVTPPEQIFFKDDELIELAGELKGTVGQISFRQVGDLRSRNLQILHERYAPGADTGRTMLQHESEEGGIVIKGQIELTVGERKQLLGPGDAYFFDSRVPHRFRNVGEEECELISACTPPYL